MQQLKPYKIGLVLGAFIGCWHLVWSILVALGWAQPLVNFIFWLHFVTPPYQVGAFQPARALGLVVVTAAIGFIIGYFLGVVWNGFFRQR